MLSGLPEINIEDWRRYTEYSGYDDACPQIQVSIIKDSMHYFLVHKFTKIHPLLCLTLVQIKKKIQCFFGGFFRTMYLVWAHSWIVYPSNMNCQ